MFRRLTDCEECGSPTTLRHAQTGEPICERCYEEEDADVESYEASQPYNR